MMTHMVDQPKEIYIVIHRATWYILTMVYSIRSTRQIMPRPNHKYN